MKSFWNKFSNLILHGINGTPFDYYLFLFLFFSRLFELLIAGNIFSVFDTYQHEFLLFEKYTYFLTAGYMALYFLVYFINNRRFPLNRTMFLSFLFFLTAVVSTFINQGMAVHNDYFTKLSLMELMMTVLFMFYTASRLNESQFRKLMRVAGKGYIYLILFLNIISLIVYFIQPAEAMITVFGSPVELPLASYEHGIAKLYSEFDGFYRNSSTLGTHCALAFTISFYLFREKSLHPATFIISITTNAFLISLSHSRTGIIEIIIVVLILIAFHISHLPSNGRKLLQYYYCFLLIAAIIGSVFLWKKILALQALHKRSLLFAFDRFTSGRLEILIQVWNIFKTHPIIGEGWHVKILEYDTAHNFLLTAAAWTGIIGLVLIISLLISVVRKSVKNGTIQKNITLFLIPFSVFIQCMFEQGILGDARHAYTYMFWLVLGYFAADRKEDINPSAVNG